MRTLMLVTLLLTAGCSRVPYSGRAQFNVIPDKVMTGIGKSSYSSLLDASAVAAEGRDVAVLDDVGGRMTGASGADDLDWSYALIQDPTVNAFCLPGGYIAFYSGILPVLENEASMAFVMGHEIGHVVAHHGAERLSQKLAVFGGLAGVQAYLDGNTEFTAEQRTVMAGALGLGAEYGVLLPFSRKHEKEADVIGMMMMARAGYPPDEALVLWQRMAERSGSSTPAFLSTHPADETRIEALRDWLPKARKRYERNAIDHDTLAPRW